MRCLYTSDLHGNRWLYDRLFEAAGREEAEAIVLGGDLSPLVPPLDHMKDAQRRFWEDDLRPRCEAVRARGVRVLLIPGNDDLRSNDDVLEREDEAGTWELVDGRTAPLGDATLLGLADISLTPFILKDRELYDVTVGDRQEDAVDLRAPEVLSSVPLDDGRLETTLHDRLDSLLDGASGPTIVMAHVPPRGTKLDVLFDGRHVGSVAVREAIERHRPVLGLHGHIHESPAMKDGDWIDRIGPTPIVNPGSNHHDGEKATLRLVSFDTRAIDDTLECRRI